MNLKNSTAKGICLALLTGASNLLFAAGDFETFSIQKVKGDSCEIKSSGKSASWVAAKDHDIHKTGSRGRTGDDSSFVVSFDEENSFRLLADTEVVISATARSSGYQKVVNLSMSQGKVEIDLKAFPKNYQFKVQTPTAVCGAIGTSFDVSADSDQKNMFKCKNGTIFARSLEDRSFDAAQIHPGQSLTAIVKPGKENSYTKLETSGGTIPVSIGSDDHSYDIQRGSVVQLAQEHTEKVNQVAIKVDQGDLGGNKKGYYVMDGAELLDYSKEKGPRMVDDYLEAAKKEGTLRAELNQARAAGTPKDELNQLQIRLDTVAEEATQKRKELFHYRDVIRRSIRDSMNLNQSRPPNIPR